VHGVHGGGDKQLSLSMNYDVFSFNNNFMRFFDENFLQVPQYCRAHISVRFGIKAPLDIMCPTLARGINGFPFFYMPILDSEHEFKFYAEDYFLVPPFNELLYPVESFYGIQTFFGSA
jgi:hypothetical protein